MANRIIDYFRRSEEWHENNLSFPESYRTYIQYPTSGSMPTVIRATSFDAAVNLQEWRCLFCSSLSERIKFNCRNCGAPR